MEKAEIRHQILSALDHLSKNQQERLLAFIKSLIYKKTKSKKPDILSLAGTIDKHDLKLMEEAIQEDCEKINPHEW